MALDFHKVTNNEYLFGLDDKKLANLEAIFDLFKDWSGMYIDPYKDTLLTVENQKVIIKIIDAYIDKKDLNVNKQQTIDVVEFRALMSFFSNKRIVIKIIGD